MPVVTSPHKVFSQVGDVWTESIAYHIAPRSVFKFASDPTVFEYTTDGRTVAFTSWEQFLASGWLDEDIQELPDEVRGIIPEKIPHKTERQRFSETIRAFYFHSPVTFPEVFLRDNPLHDLIAVTKNLEAGRSPGFGIQPPTHTAPNTFGVTHRVDPVAVPEPPHDYMSGNIYISSLELSDWSNRSGSYADHQRAWIGHKLKTGHGAHHELGVDLDDQAQLDKLHGWLTVLTQHGKKLHLWAQGDREHQERGLPRADWNRLLNHTDNLSDILNDFPGAVSLGVGFDTFEWVPGASRGDYGSFHAWVDEMRSLCPWLLVGGRPQGAWATNDRHVLSREEAAAWNSHSTYYSVEGGVVTENFVREIRDEASKMGLPALSENRDRLGNTPEGGLPHGYSYSDEELVEAITWYRRHNVAAIVANWRDRTTRDHPRSTRTLPDAVYEAIDQPVGG